MFTFNSWNRQAREERKEIHLKIFAHCAFFAVKALLSLEEIHA
jgi:hypothetical protein